MGTDLLLLIFVAVVGFCCSQRNSQTLTHRTTRTTVTLTLWLVLKRAVELLFLLLARFNLPTSTYGLLAGDGVVHSN